MAYNRRSKLINLAKQQMRENDIEYTPPTRERVSETDEFQEGYRSAYKVQQNLKRKTARRAQANISNDIYRKRRDRGTDSWGRDWAPMPEGTLIKFTRPTNAWSGSQAQRIEKDTLATVIKEYDEDGKRFVDALIGAQVMTVRKSVIEEV